MKLSCIVDFKNVTTVGLESSPIVEALAGLRAHEARYFMNKYKHEFIVVPASASQKTLDYVNRILKEERDIEFAAKPLETSYFQVENIKFAYVFYEDGLVINVMYTLDNPKRGLLDLSFLMEWRYQQNWQRNLSLLGRSLN